MRFVDTNVLLYAISAEADEADKSAVARELLAARDLALSVQVLQEFFHQATRTNRPHPVTPADARDLVESLLRLPVAPITVEVLRSAIGLSSRWSLSYWDAAIIEAARSLGCQVVLSEDMADGQDYDGVRVENPFKVAS